MVDGGASVVMVDGGASVVMVMKISESPSRQGARTEFLVLNHGF
jgi:hypothetical protein